VAVEEEMVAECRNLLSNVTLQSNVSGSWQWQPDIAGGYLVRTCYQLLTSQEPLSWMFQIT